jgi:hypothetical protein
LEVRESPEL